MLPTIFSGPPSGSGGHDGDDDDPHLKRSARSSWLPTSVPLVVRKVVANPSLLKNYKPQLISGVLVLVLLFLLLRPKRALYSVEPLKWGTEAKNWGDYVAQGQARSKILTSTPTLYADLTTLNPPNKRGSLFASRLYPSAFDVSKSPLVRKMERDRHGVLGGGSVLWSGGVVGSGEWLGRVDMRKKDPVEMHRSAGAAAEDKESVLAGQILAQGWEYLDEEDEKRTKVLLEKARKDGTMDKLPLRDRVRDDDEKRKQAASGWARIYESSIGEGRKSALEIAVEKTVRSVGLVVFSKTTCPHSKRAKALLAKYTLAPAPYIVEVDLRPDGTNLKALLTRLTGHSTFPNIVIGSVSIGGADDLEQLEQEGRLRDMLLKSGVVLK